MKEWSPIEVLSDILPELAVIAPVKAIVVGAYTVRSPISKVTEVDPAGMNFCIRPLTYFPEPAPVTVAVAAINIGSLL